MNIVIVEDNKDIVMLWEVALRDEPVQIAHNVEEAKALNWDIAEAAVIDMNLEGTDLGSELVYWAQEHFPDVKILLVTAREYKDIPDDLHSLVLRKPLSVNEIRVALLGEPE